VKSQELLIRISKCKGIYGRAAKRCLNDKKNAMIFIQECYCQIQSNPNHAKKTFGLEVCADIITCCKISEESQVSQLETQ